MPAFSTSAPDAGESLALTQDELFEQLFGYGTTPGHQAPPSATASHSSQAHSSGYEQGMDLDTNPPSFARHYQLCPAPRSELEDLLTAPSRTPFYSGIPSRQSQPLSLPLSSNQNIFDSWIPGRGKNSGLDAMIEEMMGGWPRGVESSIQGTSHQSGKGTFTTSSNSPRLLLPSTPFDPSPFSLNPNPYTSSTSFHYDSSSSPSFSSSPSSPNASSSSPSAHSDQWQLPSPPSFSALYAKHPYCPAGTHSDTRQAVGTGIEWSQIYDQEVPCGALVGGSGGFVAGDVRGLAEVALGGDVVSDRSFIGGVMDVRKLEGSVEGLGPRGNGNSDISPQTPLTTHRRSSRSCISCRILFLPRGKEQMCGDEVCTRAAAARRSAAYRKRLTEDPDRVERLRAARMAKQRAHRPDSGP